ncbi:N utilization substance protein B [Bacteroidia bacterium]|nr:N utilization substance protein B [Bacteroidia bacterium]
MIKALYAHLKSESDSLTASLKTLGASVDKTFELYHLMLRLMVDVADYASRRIELGRAKRLPTPEELNPNRRFVDSALVAQIAGSKPLGDYLAKRSLDWAGEQETVKVLYNALSNTEFYRQYMSTPHSDYRSDVHLAEQFYSQIVAESEQMEEVLEEWSLLWADDMDFALIMAMRTLSACRADQFQLPLLPQFKNDDDRRFPGELFTASLTGYDEYMSYVERFAKNWDVERIAFLDGLVMTAAIAELVSFPSIPVKVTLDEYIEISKYYSTPSSCVFINGILDKVVEELRSQGRITKSGRGLL